MSKKKRVKKTVSKGSKSNLLKYKIIGYSPSGNTVSASDFFSALDGLYSKSNCSILLSDTTSTENDREELQNWAGEVLYTEDITESLRYICQSKKDNSVVLVDLDRVHSIPLIIKHLKSFKRIAKSTGACLPIVSDPQAGERPFIFLAESDQLSYALEHVTADETIIKNIQGLLNGWKPKALVKVDSKTEGLKQRPIAMGYRLKALWNWHITVPLKEYKTRPHERFQFLGQNSLYRTAFFALAVISLFLMTTLSQNAAVSGDEYRYQDQASRVYNYYATFGEDKAAVTQRGIDPQHYNSQSFDNILFTVQKWLGMPPDSFGFRHFWNAVVGWLAMLFAALIALRIGGYRMALIAFVLLLLSPRFLGHSYNNHRDIPMAASVCFAVYFMIPYLKSLPKIQWRYMLWVVLGIAWAYSLRLGGGVLVMGYLLAFTGLAYLVHVRNIKNVFSEIPTAAKMLGLSLITCAGGFAVGVLTWPYALESPIANSMEVLAASAELGVSLRQVFEGEQIWSNAMPWYYTGKYMLITIPAFILACFGLSFFMIKKVIDRTNVLPYLMVLGAVILPIYYALFQVNTHYGGWRHFTFVYPFIGVMAAMGVEGLFRWYHRTKFVNFIWLGLAIFMIHPVLFILKNHPMEYTYFNEIIGGTQGAHGYYETDYSLNSLQEASNWLIENVLESHEGDTLIIATNDRRASQYYLRNYKSKAKVQYTRYYDKSGIDWDYATFYCSLISPHQIREGYWPPVETVHEVSVDGVPLGATVKRVSKEDLLGFEALERNDPQAAVNYFISYLEKNPYSEEVWGALAQIQMQSGQHEEALMAAEESLKIMPDYTQALQIKTSVQLNTDQVTEALYSADQLIASAERHFVGYYYKALALQRLDRHQEAIEAGEYAMRLNPGFKGTYQLMAESFNALGNREMANRVLQLMQQQAN